MGTFQGPKDSATKWNEKVVNLAYEVPLVSIVNAYSSLAQVSTMRLEYHRVSW